VVIETFNALAGGDVRVAITDPDHNNDEVDISGNTESPRIVTDAARGVDGGGSLRLQCPSNTFVEYRHALSGAPIDADSGSTTEDYISFWIRVRHPGHVKSMEIDLYVGTAPFNPASPGNNFYHREFTVKLVNSKKKKRLRALGDLITDRDTKNF